MKTKKTAWNKDKVVGAKPPLTPEQVQLIKMLLASHSSLRDQLLFYLAVDSSFRGSDLVRVKVSDVTLNGEVQELLRMVQKKTGNQITAYLSEPTRELIVRYIEESGKSDDDYLFTREKGDKSEAITAHRYRELFKDWLAMAGLNKFKYGTHSIRRTKTSLIYSKTGNLRSCQILLGHKSITNTARYLGIEGAEALEIAKKFNI